MKKEELISILEKFNKNLTSPAQLLPRSDMLQVSSAGAGGQIIIQAEKMKMGLGASISADGGDSIVTMNINDFNFIKSYLAELIEELKQEKLNKNKIQQVLKKLRSSFLPSAFFEIILNLVAAAIGKFVFKF